MSVLIKKEGKYVIKGGFSTRNKEDMKLIGGIITEKLKLKEPTGEPISAPVESPKKIKTTSKKTRKKASKVKKFIKRIRRKKK